MQCDYHRTYNLNHTSNKKSTGPTLQTRIIICVSFSLPWIRRSGVPGTAAGANTVIALFFELELSLSNRQLLLRREGRRCRMAALVARTGRQRQLYNNGFRLMAGCIPYRFTRTGDACDGESVETLEVLMVTRRRGDSFIFPKGGWEDDETKEEAALRESLEEAGVKGHIEADLGSWPSKYGRCCDEHSLQGSSTGYMFALNVTELLDSWPEKDVRQRKWVTVTEAKGLCRHPWMLNALEKCIDYLSRRLSISLSESVDGCTSRILSQPTCEDEKLSEQSTCEDEEPSEQSTCEETDSSLTAIESNKASTMLGNHARDRG